MNPLHWLALPLAVAAALVGSPARAAGGTNHAVGQAIWNAATKGKTTTIAPGGKITTIAPAGGGGSPIAQVATAGNTASGGVAITGTGTAPVNGKGVPVTATGTIDKTAVASGVAAVVCAVGTGGACAVAAAAAVAMPLALNWIANAGVTRNPTTGALEVQDTANAFPSDGYKYSASALPSGTPIEKLTWPEVCIRAIELWQASNAGVSGSPTITYSGGASWNQGDPTCPNSVTRFGQPWLTNTAVFNNPGRSVSTCPAGYYSTPAGCYSASNLPKVAVDGGKLVDLLVSKGGTPDPGIVPEVTSQGGTLTAGDISVSGPTAIPGPTTINISNTSNGPVTTTTTTTNNYTYNGNSVTNSGTKTTTETKQPDGTTSTTTEETVSPGDEQEAPEPSPVDTPLGELPKLYERKYPDGIVGIWNDKRQQLNQTQLFQLPQQLMPTGIGGGSCPSFKIPLDFAAFGDYGEADVSPPCWVYDVIKVIVLIGAAILARALIFGG
ncbi:Uncharacterised protein [Xylophilus ampelinus]|nr:Uncharacterised protein [Xylophilus ampelinus]